MNKFINFISDCIKKPVEKLKLWHQLFQQYDEETQTIPYYAAIVWIVEILSFGIWIAIVYVDLFMLKGVWKWILFPFAVGSLRLLWVDFIEITTKAIKEKKT